MSTVKYISFGILAFVVVGSLSGVFLLNRFGKDEIYDQREISNENFRIRITAYKEKYVFPPGVYFVLQSAKVGSDKWQDVMTKKGDEPIPIREQQLRFINQRTGYAFIGSYYMVTTNAGENWTIWDGEKQVSAEYKKRNLSPYIEDIQLQPDGTGRMKLYNYFNQPERGPDLFTSDFGLNWSLKE